MKVLVVDDSYIIRKALQNFITSSPSAQDLRIVGEAADGVAAMRLFEEKDPDLITMDITMPKMDGLTCIEKMMSLKPSARIIVISALNDKETALQALTKGALTFIPKPFSRESFEKGLSKALEGPDS